MRFIVGLCLVFLVGCTPLSNEINNSPYIQNQSLSLNETNGIDNEISNSSVFFCEQDTDCMLIFGGCPVCPPCGGIGVSDPRVISVNKFNYRDNCAPRPKGIACLACAGSMDIPQDYLSKCVNNRCEK